MKILMTAYAVNPYKGSEDGMGWNFVCQAARFHKIIAITRKNNRSYIERYLSYHDFEGKENLQFAYYDLPYWMRFWKIKSFGALLYFYLWQLFIPLFIRRNKLSFDIVHNLNFHNDWTPSTLWIFKKPMVWGPIGHHPRIPKGYILPIYGYLAYLKDRIKHFTKVFIRKVDPFLMQTILKSDKVLTMNSASRNLIDPLHKKSILLPSVGTEKVRINKYQHDIFRVLSIGRFVPLKGFDMSIKSFHRFYNKLSDKEKIQSELILVGAGPKKKMLKKMAKDYGIEKAIVFVDWMKRDELVKLYNQSQVFLFPSHEGAGMVVAEALSFAMPVICYDNTGPGEFINNTCGLKVPYTNYHDSIQHFANHLTNLYENKKFRQKLSEGAQKQFLELFEWNKKGEQLAEVYRQLLTA